MTSPSLPLAAIDSGVLYVNSGRYFLKKGSNPLVPDYWTGAGGPEDRAYIEFRGPETDEGRSALQDFQRQWAEALPKVDENGKPNDSRSPAELDKQQMNVAVRCVNRMILDWRLFDDRGLTLLMPPHDIDDATGKTHATVLLDHWAERAPRKIIDMANFLKNLGNF